LIESKSSVDMVLLIKEPYEVKVSGTVLKTSYTAT